MLLLPIIYVVAGVLNRRVIIQESKIYITGDVFRKKECNEVHGFVLAFG